MVRSVRDADGRRAGGRDHRYLNNVVEQDHRAIKQRCAPMLGLKSFQSAAITLAGIELVHRIRKQQYSVPMGEGGNGHSLKDYLVSLDIYAGAAHLSCPFNPETAEVRCCGRSPR